MLRQALWLVKNGVPLDVALSLPDEERFAWYVVMGEHEGGRFNWVRGDWES